MKEKFDLSLDNRQVVSLLISGVVVLGAVFVLGVVVGKKLAVQTQAVESRDLLTTLDAQAAADAGPSGGLTFQDELTRKPPELVMQETSAPAPAPPIAPPPPAPPAAMEPVAKPEVIKPEPKPERPPEPKVEPKIAAKPLPPKEVKPPAVSPPAPTQPAQTPPANATVRSIAVATRQLATSPSPAPAPTAQAPKDKRSSEASTGGGQYSLQIAASQSKPEADKFAAKLRDRGYAPYIVEVTVPDKGVWYRVRMGSFTSKDAAQKYLQDFKRETKMDAMVAGGR